MSLFKPLKVPKLNEQPLRLWETGPAHAEFEPTWRPQETAQTFPRKFPRDWKEVEAIIAERLAQFEERHRSHCEAAFERGVQEGMRRREEEVQRKQEAAREPLANIAIAVEQQLAALRVSTYRQVTELSAALTEALLRRVLAINPAVYTAALHDALEPLAHLDDITVRLNPVDARSLREAIACGDEEYIRFGDLKIIADPQVDMGGAMAESAGGSVDCRLETRLSQAFRIIDAVDS